MNWKILLGAIVVMAAAAGYVLYSSSQSPWNQAEKAPPAQESAPGVTEKAPEVTPPASKPEAEATPAPQPEAPAVVEEAPPPEPAFTGVMPPPRLEGSDPTFLEAVADVSNRAVQWLTPEEQVRKWVLAVDQLADEKMPAKNLPVSYEKDPYLVLKEGEFFLADKGNQTRFTPLVDAISRMDPEQAAAYYRSWLPLFENAYRELGKSGSFDARFRAVLDNMIYAPVPPEDARLVRPHIFFKYADPELEQAPALTKFMWRLGADNMFTLQNFLRQLKGELE